VGPGRLRPFVELNLVEAPSGFAIALRPPAGGYWQAVPGGAKIWRVIHLDWVTGLGPMPSTE